MSFTVDDSMYKKKSSKVFSFTFVIVIYKKKESANINTFLN